MRVSNWLAATLAALLLGVLPAGPVQAQTPQIVGNFSDPDNAEDAIFSPDGKIVALASYFGGVTLWDIASGLPLRDLTQRAYFTANAFSADGKLLLSGHKDGTIRIWEVATGAVLTSMRTRQRPGRGAEPEMISSLWVDRKGEFFVSADRGAVVMVWSLATRKPVLTVQRPATDKSGNVPTVLAARLSADGQRLLMLTSHDKGTNSVVTYDAKSGAELSSFDLPAKHAFVVGGFVRDDEAIVAVTVQDCDLDDWVLYSFADRAVKAPLYKPGICKKSKDGEDLRAPKILSGPDSSRILLAKDGDPELQVFDLAARRPERTIRWTDVEKPEVIGVSRDLRLAAATESGAIQIRVLETGERVKELRSFTTYAETIGANLGATHVLMQRGGSYADDTPMDLALRRIDGASAADMTFAAGGKFLLHDFAAGPMLAIAGNDDGGLVLLSLDGKQEPRKLASALLRSVASARLSPDGKIALVQAAFEKSVNDEGQERVVLLDLPDGKIRHTFPADEEVSVTGVAFSPDGSKIALGLRDGSAEIWDVKTTKRLKKLPVYKEDGDTRTVAFSPDGRFLVAGSMFEDDIFMWTIDTGKVRRIYKMPDSLAGYRYATSVALSNDGKTLAAGLGHRAISSGDIGAERGGVIVWDAETGKRRFALRGHRGAIMSLTFSANDKWIVSASLDGTVRYWDRATGKLMATAAVGVKGRWFVLSEAGFYAGSDGSDDAISIVRGTSAQPLSSAREILSRPDLIEALLKGDPERKYLDAAKTLDLSKIAASPR